MSGLNENRPITQQILNTTRHDVDTTASYGGVQLYSVLAEDGFIYSIVESGTMAQLRQLDPDTLEDILYCNLGVYTGGCGIIQAANSKLYVIPERTTQIMEIDLVNKTVFHFGAFPTGNTRMYYCAHLAPNGNFYMIPYTSAQVVEVNPFTKTCTFIGESVSGYIGCTMGKDGIIYSFKHDTILKVNPGDNTVTEEPLARLDNYTYHGIVVSTSCCVTTTGEMVIMWANYTASTTTGIFTLSHYNPTTKSHTYGLNYSLEDLVPRASSWNNTSGNNYYYPCSYRFWRYLYTKIILLNNNNIMITSGGNGNSSHGYTAHIANLVYDISSRTTIYRGHNYISSGGSSETSLILPSSFLINNNTTITPIYMRNDNKCIKTDTGFAKVIPKTAYMSPYINKMR